MTDPRSQIIHDFAKWTALSALRSGAPVKSRARVYPLLDGVGFDRVLSGDGFITREDFDAWYEEQALAMRSRNDALPIGWVTKLINVYLKTAGYVGELGRPGLRGVIHPPIDAGLWNGFAGRFGRESEIVREVCCVSRIKAIDDYETYQRIINGCRRAAEELGCLLIEVEQLWQGAITPGNSRRRSTREGKTLTDDRRESIENFLRPFPKLEGETFDKWMEEAKQMVAEEKEILEAVKAGTLELYLARPKDKSPEELRETAKKLLDKIKNPDSPLLQ